VSVSNAAAGTSAVLPPPSRLTPALGLAVEHGIDDFYQGAVPALVPLLVLLRGYDLIQAGGVVLAATLLSSVAQPAFGVLADRRPLPWLRPAGLLLAAGGISAVGLLGTYGAIWVAAMISGLGVAAYHPEAARAVHASGGGDRAMGWFTFGGLAGYAAGPPVTVAVLGTLGLAASPLLALPAVAAAAAGLIRLRFRSVPSLTAAAAQQQGSEDWPRFALLTVVVVLRSVAYFGVVTLVVVHLTSRRGLGLGAATAVLTTFTATGAIGTLLGGYLTRWADRVTVIAASYLLAVPALAGLAFAAQPTVLLGCAGLLGLALHVPVALHTTLGQQYLPRHLGTAAGVTLGLAVSAGGLAAPVLGAGAERLGTTSLLAIVAALPLLAATTAAALAQRQPPETADASADHDEWITE